MADEPGRKDGKPPQVDVGDQVKDLATHCRKAQCCMRGEAVCRVVDCVAEKVFFVEGEVRRHCSYRLGFGKSYCCNCPVRQELFRKYKI
jgi:hypothetical protein